MTNKEKIELLKAKPPKQRCLEDYYQDLLDKVGSIKRDYGNYMTTKPINCDEELKRTFTADYELCCALLTMLFREDHFAEYGCFENRCEKGDVQKIIDRMIFLLEQKEESIKRRLAGRAVEYMMFKDDEENTESKPGISSSNNVIVFPDFEKLKSEVEKMRTELSMLLLERDELQFVICKNIETEYMLKLGSIEYKAYEAQCAALRLKRKIELIQAKKNRQEKVIISSIEDTLDNEFAEYQKQLDEQIDKMNDALKRSKAEVLSDEDNKELKKLYRKIVKELHPDINPDVSEAQVKLFENAVSAYKNGDLGTLRIINEMVSNSPLPKQDKDAMTQLVEEKERLQGLLKAIRESIEKIKSEYPYTMKEVLEDTEKTEQKKQELENILEQYNELISIYKTKIEEMLR